MMTTPGYYKTSLRAIRVSEMIRLRGLWQLPLTFILTKFLSRPLGGVWMPEVSREMECTGEELSPRFWEVTQTHRDAFERLGFKPCFFLKLHRNLNPMYVDQGGMNWLHGDNGLIGTLVYGKVQSSGLRRETVAIAITAVYGDESLSCSNAKDAFDSVPGHQVMRFKSDEPSFLYQQLTAQLEARQKTPRRFNGCDEARQWLDAARLKAFDARVARGLYVRMTDAEVAAARRKMPSPPPIPKQQS